uniref:RING-type domain-containing protein n=1 Tax=Leersia perrieri TaxID=77586 RepID=A0A0D9W6G3_9ORYZ
MDIIVGAVVSLAVFHLLRSGWWLLRKLAALGRTGWRRLRASSAAGRRKLRAWRKAAARWRAPIWALGGVTTLRHPLHPQCRVCGQAMARGDRVRSLSRKCTVHKACVDSYLRAHDMACPVCSRTAFPVRPWKPPRSKLVNEVHLDRRGVWTLQDDMAYDCMICLERMVAQGIVRTLACLHIFHFACIKKWFVDENNGCPICRKPDVPAPQQETRLSAMSRRRPCSRRRPRSRWSSSGGRHRRGRRVAALGGVTTLRRDLGVDCPMCRHGMVAGDAVRELSCGHVFHKDCECGVDKWLRDNNLSCPNCRRTARSVRALPRWFNARRPPPPLTPEDEEEEMMGMDLEGQEDWMPPHTWRSRAHHRPEPEEQHPPPPPTSTSSSSSISP